MSDCTVAKLSARPLGRRIGSWLVEAGDRVAEADVGEVEHCGSDGAINLTDTGAELLVAPIPAK